MFGAEAMRGGGFGVDRGEAVVVDAEGQRLVPLGLAWEDLGPRLRRWPSSGQTACRNGHGV